jgi:excisionase family DNA binding protein
MDERREAEWLTVEDVSAMLKVHGQTVRRWLNDGELRGVMLGRAGWRIRADELDRFLVERENRREVTPLAS